MPPIGWVGQYEPALGFLEGVHRRLARELQHPGLGRIAIPARLRARWTVDASTRKALTHGRKRITGSVLADGLFDVSGSQLGTVHSPIHAEAHEMVSHRTAVDSKLPSQVLQRAAILVLGGYG